MNIAIIGIRGIPANYGGFETCAENVSKYWAEKGHRVLVYCRKHQYNITLKEYNGCSLKYISSVRTKSFDTLSHTLLCCLNLIFTEPSYRYVHLYNAGNGIFIPLLKLFKRKVIVSVDGAEWKRIKWGLLGKLMHKVGAWMAVTFADGVVTDNKIVEMYYKERFNYVTATIAYGAKLIDTELCDAENILGKYGLSKKGYFIFVGRLVPEKGVHTLIAAYEQLNTTMPLVIIGDDKDGEYKNSLLKQKNDKIIFLGYVYGTQYEVLLQNALIYVSASELEGTSPSLLAAMGARVCALVNGIEENRETVKGCAYCYDSGLNNNLLVVWQQLINNLNLIEQMGEKGYKLVNNEYRWDRIANQYLELFVKLNK